MYSLYVGFILIVFILIFVWICAAGFFKFIGKVVGKFAEPFHESKDEEIDKK